MKEEGLLREILDSKSIAFSILTLCESTTRRGTIGKLNANFCLGSCPNRLKRSRHYVIEQGYLATEPAGPTRFVSAKKRKTASLTSKVGRGAHREECEIRLSPKGIFRLLELSLLRRPYIIEERHETVVHVQLLVQWKSVRPGLSATKSTSASWYPPIDVLVAELTDCPICLPIVNGLP